MWWCSCLSLHDFDLFSVVFVVCFSVCFDLLRWFGEGLKTSCSNHLTTCAMARAWSCSRWRCLRWCGEDLSLSSLMKWFSWGDSLKFLWCAAESKYPAGDALFGVTYPGVEMLLFGDWFLFVGNSLLVYWGEKAGHWVDDWWKLECLLWRFLWWFGNEESKPQCFLQHKN